MNRERMMALVIAVLILQGCAMTTERAAGVSFREDTAAAVSMREPLGFEEHEAAEAGSRFRGKALWAGSVDHPANRQDDGAEIGSTLRFR